MACSAEGAALCYWTLCIEGAQLLGTHAHPEITMHTFSRLHGVHSSQRLARRSRADASLRKQAREKSGAISSYVQTIPFIKRSPTLKRVRHCVGRTSAVVAAHAVERGFQRLGLIGTRCLVEREVYPQRLEIHGLECVRRNAAEREAINRIIDDELVYGVFTADAVAYFNRSLSK